MDSFLTKRQKNREKQSALRQRRKDYIQALESRVRRLEQLGVQATQEVQAAARRVDAENRLLREILEEQFGADASELIRQHRQQDLTCRSTEITPETKQTRKQAHFRVSVGTQTEPRRACTEQQPIRFVSAAPTSVEKSHSTVPCAHAFHMIRSVNLKGRDMADIIVELSPGFSLAAHSLSCCSGTGCSCQPDHGGSEGEKCGADTRTGDSDCVVDSRMLFKVLDDIS